MSPNLRVSYVNKVCDRYLGQLVRPILAANSPEIHRLLTNPLDLAVLREWWSYGRHLRASGKRYQVPFGEFPGVITFGKLAFVLCALGNRGLSWTWCTKALAKL